MKLLITGDIHGRADILEKVLKKHKQFDLHLNTGDLGIDIKTMELSKMTAVQGNNDIFYDLPLEQMFDIDGKKIWLTHGHLFNVKYGLDDLKNAALSRHADIVIYGHTHEPSLKIIEGMTFINPGSLCEFKGKSYAIYQDGEITFVTVD